MHIFNMQCLFLPSKGFETWEVSYYKRGFVILNKKNAHYIETI